MPTPLIYTANRDNPWNSAATASQLQFSAHRSEGRVPGLAYIVSEARAQACTQAQACWHSFHTSRRSALASEHFSEGKFEAYHKAQQTQLFLHATKPVHCGTPASTVSRSLHRHGTWMLHLQSKAVSKGSCAAGLHMLTHLLVDSSSKQKSDTGSDRVGCHRWVLSPASHWDSHSLHYRNERGPPRFQSRIQGTQSNLLSLLEYSAFLHSAFKA